MKSAFALTEEIGTKEAADEIIAQIKNKLTLEENSCGLLYYDYEMDGAELCHCLREKLGIDILGCSTIATLDNQNGYKDMSAMLTVFTGNDCEFHIGITEELTNETAREKLDKTFLETRSRAASDPTLAFVLLPCGTDIVFDKHFQEFSQELSSHIPIVGGVPSSTATVEKSIVFNGQYYTKMAAILLFTGNIHPVFSIANVISTFSDRKDIITKACGTSICEIGGKPFLEYLESFGIEVADPTNILNQVFFQKYPLLIENEDTDFNDEIPFVRMLDRIDEQTGHGIGYASFPQGATITLATLKREDMTETVERGVKELFEKMKASGRQYSTVICISCAGRHNTMNPHYDDEGNAIKRLIPADKYNLSGFYSYGELCPVAMENGKVKNQLHNGSIVFCAL